MDHFKKHLLICTDNCDFVSSFASSAYSTLNHVNQDSSDLDIESKPNLNASTVENTLTPIELDHVECTSIPVEHSSVLIPVEGDHAENRPVSENDEGLDFSNTTSKSYWRDHKMIVLIAWVKSRSVRGASHQPAFMSSCLTIIHTFYLPYLLSTWGVLMFYGLI